MAHWPAFHWGPGRRAVGPRSFNVCQSVLPLGASLLSPFKRLARGFPAAYGGTAHRPSQYAVSCSHPSSCSRGTSRRVRATAHTLGPTARTLAPWEHSCSHPVSSSSQMWEQLARTTGGYRAAQRVQTSFFGSHPASKGVRAVCKLQFIPRSRHPRAACFAQDRVQALFIPATLKGYFTNFYPALRAAPL